MSAGVANKVKTHCKRGHAFDQENTQLKYVDGYVFRQCRACQQDCQRATAVARNRRYAARHPHRFKKQKAVHARNWRYRNVYGISPEDHARIFEEQGGLCEIPSCSRPIGATDHSHATKTFRGLLCKQCNSVLGFASDRPEILKELTTYLEKHIV